MSEIYDIFISYAEANGDWVRGYLIDALDAAEVHYCSEEDFRLGVPWILEFERCVKQSQQTLLILSPAYMTQQTSEFVELLGQVYGLETGTWPVIPLILHPIKLPPRLAQLTGLDATHPEQWQRVIERLCDALSHQVPNATPKTECPYPGMVPFSEQQSDRFFGREQEIEELLEKLRLSPFVTVIGPSGSGKSSLVYAGLIPKLQSTQRLGSGEWLILKMRPGEMPLTTLTTYLEGDVENSQQTIASLLQRHQAQRLFLLVDQFEEVFTLAEAEAIPFQHQLLKLIEDSRCYLLLTVRADFYSELMQSPLWRKIKGHRLEVIPLDDQGLKQAILKPAEAVDVIVESALVERLVTDAAGEPGVLPFIQETLVVLWEKLERRFLSLRAYEQLVLPRKAYGGEGSEQLTGLQVAIARRADAAIADLTEEQQLIARRIFLRLIQFGEGRADTRRQQGAEALRALGDRDEVFESTLQHLVNSRLLTLSGGEGDERKADIAHEALISGWPALQHWIMKRREAEQTRRRLAGKTAEWIRLGQGKGGLLDELELVETERWLNSPDGVELGWGERLQDLVKMSRTTIEAAKQKEEKAQQRELNLVRERLEQEKIATENERKARKATQRTFQATIGFLAIATGIAVFAGMQWRQAEKGEIIAQVEISKAQFAQNRDTFDALIPAIEAGERFKQSIWWRYDSKLKPKVMEALIAAVYWTKERNRLTEHTGFVQSVAFSPDGSLLASGSYDHTVRLWKMGDQEDNQPLQLRGHDEAVMGVSFSPDSQVIASASQDKTLRLWNREGKPMGLPRKHEDILYDVSFSPDGKTIATGDRQGFISLWEIRNNQVVFKERVKAHESAVYALSFSPDSTRNLLVSAGADGKLIFWDGNEQWKLTKNLPVPAHENEIVDVSFSNNGELIATVGEDQKIKLWNLDGNLQQVFEGSQEYLSVSFSSDDRKIITGTLEGSLEVWDRATQSKIKVNGHNLRINSISARSDGTVATASNDSSVKLWKLISTKLTLLTGHTDSVRSVDFHPNGQTLATASADRTIKLWNLNGHLLDTLEKHTKSVSQVAFSQNGEIIASISGWDKTLRFWQEQKLLDKKSQWSNIKSQKIDIRDTGDMNIVNIDRSSDNFGVWAFAGADGKVQFFSNEQNIFSPVAAHQASILSLSFLPESKILATASDDSTAKLWQIKNNEVRFLQDLKGHNGGIYDVSFNSDGTKITTASKDGTARLWNQEGNLIHVFKGHEDAVNRARFSPDEKFIATSSDDGTIKLWNLDAELLMTLIGHEKSVNSISFNPTDSNIILSGSEDNTAILWDLKDLTLENLLNEGCNMIKDYLQQNRDSLSTSQKICQ